MTEAQERDIVERLRVILCPQDYALHADGCWDDTPALAKWCALAGLLSSAAAEIERLRSHSLPPGGWALVPVTPTKEMLLEGNDGIDDDIDSWNYDSGSGYSVEPQAAYNVWKRMLAAAPDPGKE